MWTPMESQKLQGGHELNYWPLETTESCVLTVHSVIKFRRVHDDEGAPNKKNKTKYNK